VAFNSFFLWMKPGNSEGETINLTLVTDHF